LLSWQRARKTNQKKQKGASMDMLQQSLMEIESESPQEQRKSKTTSVPAVFTSLETHSAGKKGQANAVVQALTSVILERGGDTIPVAYFALILSSLPSTSNNEELDVMLFLLRLLLPEIATSVLSSKFNDISATFQTILNEKYETASIVVSTLKCIEQVMRQVAPVITVKSWTKQAKLVSLFHGLLALSIDPRAKVRKDAQSVVQVMYDHENGSATGANSGKIVGKFFVSQLLSKAPAEAKKKNTSYLFTLLTAIGVKLPLNILSNLFEAILDQMKANPNFVRTQGYVLFSSLLTYRPSPLNQDVLSDLIPKIEALKPQEQDKTSVQYYADVIANAMTLLHEINPVLAATQLTPRVENLMTLVTSTKYECYESIFTSIESMLTQIIDASMLRNAEENPSSPLHQVGEQLRQGLSFQYQPAWGFVLALFVAFFTKMNKKIRCSNETSDRITRKICKRYNRQISFYCQSSIIYSDSYSWS